MIMTVDMDYRAEKARWPSWEWQEVILADGTQCVPRGKFHDCGEIHCVGLPDTVTRIGSEAFCGCEGLRIISLQGLTEIGEGAFRRCLSLERIELSPELRRIGDMTFLGCRSLRDAAIPVGVKRIGWSAFNSCAALTRIGIPESVTEVEREAFYGCKSLADVAIAPGVAVIGGRAFQGCPELKAVRIPGSVVEIGDYAFGYDADDRPIDGFMIRGCRGSMAEIYAGENGFGFFPEDDPGHGDGEGAFDAAKVAGRGFEIGRGILKAYSGDDDRAVVPNGVRYIAPYLSAYEGIASLSLPEGLLSVGEGAFQGGKMRSLAFPATLLLIDRYAFADCDDLERVTLPGRLLFLREGAFSDCPKLQWIEIPGDLREIERGAFRACHPDLTICAPAGGEAERYAGENGFRFEAIGQAASATR